MNDGRARAEARRQLFKLGLGAQSVEAWLDAEPDDVNVALFKGAREPTARLARLAEPDVDERRKARRHVAPPGRFRQVAPEMLAPPPKDETLREAYLDACRVLSRENSCSTFYGGPASSVAVLNRLVRSARKGALEAEGVGIGCRARLCTAATTGRACASASSSA